MVCFRIASGAKVGIGVGEGKSLMVFALHCKKMVSRTIREENSEFRIQNSEFRIQESGVTTPDPPKHLY
jgi:hypothetical protein